MTKSTSALLAAASFLLMGASCQRPPDPPTVVTVDRAVPVPCRIAHPECVAPAYNAAKKEQEGDVKVKLLRAEAATQSDCLRQYREALEACRQEPPRQ